MDSSQPIQGDPDHTAACVHLRAFDEERSVAYLWLVVYSPVIDVDVAVVVLRLSVFWTNRDFYVNDQYYLCMPPQRQRKCCIMHCNRSTISSLQLYIPLLAWHDQANKKHPVPDQAK